MPVQIDVNAWRSRITQGINVTFSNLKQGEGSSNIIGVLAVLNGSLRSALTQGDAETVKAIVQLYKDMEEQLNKQQKQFTGDVELLGKMNKAVSDIHKDIQAALKRVMKAGMGSLEKAMKSQDNNEKLIHLEGLQPGFGFCRGVFQKSPQRDLNYMNSLYKNYVGYVKNMSQEYAVKMTDELKYIHQSTEAPVLISLPLNYEMEREEVEDGEISISDRSLKIPESTKLEDDVSESSAYLSYSDESENIDEQSITLRGSISSSLGSISRHDPEIAQPSYQADVDSLKDMLKTYLGKFSDLDLRKGKREGGNKKTLGAALQAELASLNKAPPMTAVDLKARIDAVKGHFAAFVKEVGDKKWYQFTEGRKISNNIRDHFRENNQGFLNRMSSAIDASVKARKSSPSTANIIQKVRQESIKGFSEGVVSVNRGKLTKAQADTKGQGVTITPKVQVSLKVSKSEGPEMAITSGVVKSQTGSGRVESPVEKLKRVKPQQVKHGIEVGEQNSKPAGRLQAAVTRGIAVTRGTAPGAQGSKKVSVSGEQEYGYSQRGSIETSPVAKIHRQTEDSSVFKFDKELEGLSNMVNRYAYRSARLSLHKAGVFSANKKELLNTLTEISGEIDRLRLTALNTKNEDQPLQNLLKFGSLASGAKHAFLTFRQNVEKGGNKSQLSREIKQDLEKQNTNFKLEGLIDRVGTVVDKLKADARLDQDDKKLKR